MSHCKQGQAVEILIVEDNEGDKLVICQAFKKCNYDCHLNIVSDGARAIDFLKKQNDYKMAANVQLVILDINLPRKTGLEVLQEIRRDVLTRHIPVVVLTSSRSVRDIMNFYQNYANCFLTKPIRLDDFNAVLKGMIDFWLGQVQLPFMT